MLSYLSPSSTDLPARFESLNDDTLGLILQFVGNKSYKSFGGLNKKCKEVYITSGMTKETFVYGYGTFTVIKDKIERATNYFNDWKLYKRVGTGVVCFNRSDVLEWAVEERKSDLLKQISGVAAGSRKA